MFMALMTIMATLAQSSKAQAPTPLGYYDFDNPMKLPQGDITVADIVDILTEYSFEHQKKIVGGDYWGVTLPASREIFVSDEPDLGHRRDTVLHELYHAFYLRKGISTSGPEGEAAVYLKTHDQLVKIYRGAELEDEK